MPPPVVRHKERIPSAVLAQMTPAWEQIWFRPRPLSISIYENVFVAQEGLVLFPDGRVVEETIEQHSAAAVHAAKLEVQGLEAHSFKKFSGNVVLCRKPGAGVYGHWLLELLPKARLASQLPQFNTYMIQTVVGKMASIMRESLSMVGITSDFVVEAAKEAVWVERLVYIHGLSSHGLYMSPLAIECLHTISERVQPGSVKSIFVTRPTGSARCLVDESRVTSIARKAGYTVVDPSTMSFPNQISLFKGASKIVGVMGSALANLVFVQPEAEVHVLSPANMPDTFFWFICNHRQARMVDIRCRFNHVHGTAAWDTALTFDQEDEDIFHSSSINHSDYDAIFDPAFYARDSIDIDPNLDLLDHYMTHGWMQERSASPSFNGKAYLAAYPDVREADFNPLFHYLKYGRLEGRSMFRV